MSNYSSNSGSCRASLFRPSGKWYTDMAIDMSAFYNTPFIKDAVMEAYGGNLEKGWMLVVLDPYHMHSHPVMLIGK